MTSEVFHLFQALKADYQRNQNEDLSQKIENKLKVISRLEAKLANLTGVPIQPSVRRTCCHWCAPPCGPELTQFPRSV